MLLSVIPESGRECIPKKVENLKTGVRLNHTTLGLYTLGCFGTYTGILLSKSNSNSLALAKYLKKQLYVQIEKCSQTICWENGRLNLKPTIFEMDSWARCNPLPPRLFSVFFKRSHSSVSWTLVPDVWNMQKTTCESGSFPVLSIMVTTEFWNEKAKDAVHVILSLQKGKPITSSYKRHN